MKRRKWHDGWQRAASEHRHRTHGSLDTRRAVWVKKRTLAISAASRSMLPNEAFCCASLACASDISGIPIDFAMFACTRANQHAE